MTRKLKDWLESYLNYTENSESPISYHTWCGLSVIAGALQRKVYLRWGLGRIIYPNLYIVLIGASGRTRKGVAIGIAKEFLKNLPSVTVVPESSSGRQAMIVSMKRALTNFSDPTDKKIKFHSSVTAFSEELSVFLGQGDIAYLSNLTDWYDSKEDWEYETISRGKDTLQGLCLNLMGATAPEWIQSMIPQEAVGGGFTSRIIFIVEESKRKTIPKYITTPEEDQLKEDLQEDLEKISQLAGEALFTPEAEQLYINWYLVEDTALSSGKPVITDPRFAGYCERRATHLQKLMILCSASRGDDLKLNSNDFHRALEFLLDAERNMPKTFGGLGKSRMSDQSDAIINFIKKTGITTRKSLLQKFYRDIDPITLANVEALMQQMGVVKIRLMPEDGDKTYIWIGDDKGQ
ncbi:MAG: hypothetical protein DDT31_00626 [Syntrophomonadaceae bacterium]|nr:hypothetical protein [Bacillota bacterium]